MQIIPTVGLGLAYSKLKVEDATTSLGAVRHLWTGAARRWPGVQPDIAVRPSVSIPLGLDGNDPTFGVTVAYSFGSKSAPARRR